MKDTQAEKSEPVELSEGEKLLVERLRKNPEAAMRIGEIMSRLDEELAGGASADAVEEMAIAELRSLGGALMSSWAQRAEGSSAAALDADGDHRRHSKKN